MRAMHSQLIRKQIREIIKQCKAMQTERCSQHCMSYMHNECTTTVDAFFMFRQLQRRFVPRFGWGESLIRSGMFCMPSAIFYGLFSSDRLTLSCSSIDNPAVFTYIGACTFDNASRMINIRSGPWGKGWRTKTMKKASLVDSRSNICSNKCFLNNRTRWCMRYFSSSAFFFFFLLFFLLASCTMRMYSS